MGAFIIDGLFPIPEVLAKELDSGKIAGWFQGRFEHGPRALGARSILVRA